MEFLLLFFVLLWAAWIVWAYQVAEGKGRNGCAMGCLAFFIGPFAVLISYLLTEDLPAEERQPVADRQTRRCPYCDELVRRRAILCKHCGQELKPEPLARPQAVKRADRPGRRKPFADA